MYYAYAQQPASGNLHFMARASSPGALVKPVTAALAEVDGSAAIETKPMRNAMTIALLPSRVGGAILGSIGALGLVLASIGLYGVLAYAISRRIREIGLRMALGASPHRVLRMVFANSLLLVGTGLVIGLGTAAVATRPLAMFLVPGLRPDDPLTFAAVIVVLLVVAGLATIGPALRALRVDPMVALRYE
jgi:ABC-type antimicrobial peptide transport system permease subunit